jgi:excisionase family DNA binding protein
MDMPSNDTNTGSDADPWLTVAEFADALRVRPVTVRSWITKGDLEATRSGKRKWLLRRSQLERMLGGARGGTALPAPRRPESETLPEEDQSAPRFPPPIGTRDSVRTLLESAAQSIYTSFTASAYAPPSAGYVDRLRAIADGFEHFAATSIHAGKTAGATWNGRDDWTPERLPHEVRPGGNRPRRTGLWDRFDTAYLALGAAMAGHDIVAVGQAFREAGDELLAVADELAEEDGEHAGRSVR